ncbi:hypothetical protein D3C87_1240630 [compost metagenome]
MHGTDAGAHDQRTERQLPQRQARLADQPQGKAAGENAGQQRKQGDADVVAQIDGQLEGEHADEVHRPDAHPHGEGAAGSP